MKQKKTLLPSSVVIENFSSSVLFCFETVSLIAQVGLEVALQVRMILNSRAPCFYLPSSGLQVFATTKLILSF